MKRSELMTRAKGPKYQVYFRRRREGRTNYAKRLALIKSRKTRMVVRKTNSSIIIQFVNFDFNGDKTLVTVPSTKLKKLFSWPAKRNVYTAYLTGLYAGKEAKKKNVVDFVLDVGLHQPTKGNVLFAALKGALDAGLKTAYSEEMIPAAKLAAPPDAIKAAFEETKKKING